MSIVFRDESAQGLSCPVTVFFRLLLKGQITASRRYQVRSQVLYNSCPELTLNRNTLVCNMLSYVEFYQPSYFLLENVTGMLNCSLNGEQHGMQIVGGVKLGIVKFIVCALTTLGFVFASLSLLEK